MVSLGSPRTGEDEIEAVNDLLSRGELSVGNVVEEFEERFCEFAGRENAAAVCSGSVALELALEVSDLEDGDEVIVSPFNCAAVLYSLIRQNLCPVFCDIRKDSYNIDPDFVKNELGRQEAEGILLTPLYGQSCEMDRLIEIAKDNDLMVINDFGQSPGAKYDENSIATYGDIGVCSFGATKNITTAEGGMVVSDNPDYTERVKTLRSNTNGDFETPLRSVRMNDIEAAIGIQQLKKYDSILTDRQRVAEYYLKELTSNVVLPKTRPNRTNVYHGFPIRTEDNIGLREYLSERDVESSIVYEKPLYDYSLAPSTDASRFPNTERVTDKVLLLPIHPNLTEDDMNKVVTEVNSYFD
ncbi:MAG: DegT/DnrJ/EryC1/StrS family aminotransferase [Halobacteria archaeon]|nr:DegT/DnrJ/EryC1/StrS family aminotransferase [Halobacteria archaeon]